MGEGRGEGDETITSHIWSAVASRGVRPNKVRRDHPIALTLALSHPGEGSKNTRAARSSLQRRLAIARRAVHRILVEPRNDVLAEELSGVQRRRLRLTGSQDAEDDLV